MIEDDAVLKEVFIVCMAVALLVLTGCALVVACAATIRFVFNL